MQKANKPDIIEIELDNLEIGSSLEKKALVKKLYGMEDFFTTRSFDVHFCKAKKMLPKKNFRVSKGIITRVN